MLKFIKQHMATIDGIDIFPIAAFLIFFSIFLFVLWWVRGMGRQQVDHMSALPLAGADNQANTDHAH